MAGVEANEIDRSFWRNRPVLITGSTGFLGAHLADVLVDAGATVIALTRDQVRLPPGIGDWMPDATIVHGDVRDQTLMERVLGEHEVATVFHLAAQAQVGVANRNALSTFESNVRGTWTLLEAALRSSVVEQVIVASSDKAYGTQPTLPYTEDMPLLAINPYDVSKACADMITLSYHRVFGVPASITRCGNFFGPGDTSWQRLVPGTIRSLLQGERPVIRSDGTLVRDYLYVRDGALAYARLAEVMAREPAAVGEAFNFSTESQLSVLELTELITKAVGRGDLAPDVQNIAQHEIPHQHLSAEKARRVLGWEPRYSVEDALAITVEWYRRWLAP